jgi:hypothetical protein
MKILAVGSHTLPDPNKQSQVDWWRIGRPMYELAKNTGWQIDHEPSYIPGFAKYEKLDQFTEVEMERAFEKVSGYDIVFSSYHPDPTAYTLLKVARDKAGVQFVMDCDDDMFAINPDNPFWMKMDDEKVYWMQRMISDNDWITTPSPVLAERFRERRPDKPVDSVTVIPNFIGDVYKHPSFDNGKDIVIGYCGGASHYADLHESGVLEALQKLMHEDKRIRFKSVGMLIDQYLPKARTTYEGGKRGTLFFDEVFPSLNFDIAIGPLLNNIFNQGKSNIKWQEMTRAGAAFVASDVGPYKTLHGGVDALLVKNTAEDWYKALKKLVDTPKLRNILLENARKEVSYRWLMERNWTHYKQLFERVKEKSSAKSVILQVQQ